MNVVSYNLRKNRAAHELEGLVEATLPDVLCLQECDVETLPGRIGPLALAEATRANRLGIAVLYRDDRFSLVDSETFQLKKSLHGRVAAPAHERLVASRLHDAEAGRDLLVASFHGAPLTARNALRRTQIRSAFQLLGALGPDLPTIMVGDYNYPFFQRGLERRVGSHGFRLSVTSDRTYQRYRIFRGRYDLATSTGFRIDQVASLPQGDSDHHPILLSASYEDRPTEYSLWRQALEQVKH